MKNDRELIDWHNRSYAAIAATIQRLVREWGMPRDMVRHMLQAMANADVFENALEFEG